MWLALKSPLPPTESPPGLSLAAWTKSSTVSISLSAATMRALGVLWKK